MKLILKRSFNAILLLVVGLICTSCAMPSQPTTAAQKRYEAIMADLEKAGSTEKQCSATVYNSPDFGLLRSHISFEEENPTFDQMGDEAKATSKEISALRIVQPKLRKCREAVVNRLSKTLPTTAPILNKGLAQNDAAILELIKQNISWGEYTNRRKLNSIATSKELVDEGQRVLTQLGRQNAAELRQQEADLAQRRAEFATMMGIYQNQQIINQNQQRINDANRPITTNCNKFGNNVNCTSY